MIWWKNRQTLKHARELVAGTRKLLRIHRDVLDPRRVQEVAAGADDLAASIAAKDIGAVGSCREKLEKQLDKAFPRAPYAAVRENVEVLLVAILVAMAVRTFFLQPFKIPTGSMQPTLFGIHAEKDCDPNASLPKRLFDLVWFGRSYSATGCTARGDHIFVDKFTYHFRKPNRGEVIVFETQDILDIPESSRGKFYIKRLIGLGGDTVQIQPPHVLVNGKILDSRAAFERIYSRQDGYNGYVIPDQFPLPRYIRSSQDIYRIPAKHLFVLGDNSESSLDGRFWGSLPDRALVGRAILVYWPFSRRFGPID